HKSFIDYISDFTRSGFLRDIKAEAHQLVQCVFRILEQAPDSIDFGDVDYRVFEYGTLAQGPGTGGNISLTWPVDGECAWDDNRTRLHLYKMAVANVVNGIVCRKRALWTVFYIRVLATRFRSFGEVFAPLWSGVMSASFSFILRCS